jgi:flagellar biosynthesis GTPase FlhF
MAKPGVVEVDVRYDRGSQTELAVQIPQLSQQLTGIKITDQRTLDRANELIFACKQWLDSVDRIMDPVRDATHKAWKAAIKAQDEFKEPVSKPLAVLKAAATAFIVAAEEEKRRKQEAADAEQRRLNEIEAKRVAEELKALGASKAEIKEAKQEIKAQAAPIVEAEVEKSTGQGVTWLYSAELVDLKVFLSHLTQDDYLRILFGYSAAFKKAIESELRGEATKRKDKYDIPGTKLVKTPSGRWRG